MISDERVSRFISDLRESHVRETDDQEVDGISHSVEFCQGCNDWGEDPSSWPCPIISILDHFERVDNLRDPILPFFEEMERKLALHDEWGKEGWKEATHKQLLRALNAHVAKLWRLDPSDYTAIISASADVANFAMFIANLAQIALAKETDGSKRTAGEGEDSR